MAEKTVYIIDINDKVTGKLKGVQGAAKTTDSKFRELGGSIAGALGGISLGAFAMQVINTTARFQSLSNAIKFASDTAGQGELSLYWLKDLSKTYGLPLEKMTEGFKTFQGAMMKTRFTSNEVRTMFSQVSTGAAAMGLSADDTKGIFLALGQIMGKGKVQAEELRGQIGERVPGAFAVAARAMGMTSAQLDKFMSDGKLLAEDFLPKFAAEMEATFGQGAVNNANSLSATLNRISNSWNSLILSIGNNSEGVIFHTFNGWSIMLDKIANQFKTIEDLTKEKASKGTIDALASIEDEWRTEIAKMKKAGKTKEEIEGFLSSQTIMAGGNWEAREKERQARIAQLEKENQVGVHKRNAIGAMIFGEDMYSKKALAEDNEEYAKLLEQSQRHKDLMKEIQPLSDKLVSSLYMPANVLPEKESKTKRKTAGGITLNESRNGVTNIVFNIDTFQKNEFSKDGATLNTASVKSVLDNLALALQTVMNDSQIAARQ